ncbi:MAG TPA: adenylyl-sulfate kinase, partial [Acidimicrobiales bacterium]|nr:adenylyl-sulfate kinase [Acidimicrobiales bacterium]
MQRVSDVVPHAGQLTRPQRWEALGTRGATVWFTGLSGAGKSTLAAAVEQRLVEGGRGAYRLDGDNLRTGLNADLGFSAESRLENIRRAAEVALLFADAGVVALVALISPYAEGRQRARELHHLADVPFVEVYVATSIEECARRDPKGLYARASAGDLVAFTGVDDPYEPPTDPELVVPGNSSLQVSVDRVLAA